MAYFARYTLILAMILVSANATATPNVNWSPRALSVDVPIGETKTVAVEFATLEQLDNTKLSVTPSLTPFVTIEPINISSILPKTPITVQMKFSVPANTTPGNFDGVLRLQKKSAGNGAKDANQVVASPLPIVLTASKPVDLGFSDVNFFSNTSNPMLLSYRLTNNNSVMTFLGEKDAAGNALSVNGISSELPGGNRADMQLDAQGRPSNVFLTDGSHLQFFWQSDTLGRISIITPDGKAQADVSIDLNQSLPQSSGGVTNMSQTDPDGVKIFSNILSSPLLEPSSTLYQQQTNQELLIASPSLATTNLVNAQANVSVTTSGKPISGASVYANIVPYGLGIDATGYTLLAGEVSPGLYSVGFVNFPSSTVTASNVYSTCQSITGTIGKTCEALKPIAPYMIATGCIQLGAAVTPLVSPAIAVGVIAACESAFADAQTGCTISKQSSPAICGTIAETVNLSDPDGVYIKAKASKNGQSASQTVQIPGSQTLVNIPLELPAPPCSILSFTSNAELPDFYKNLPIPYYGIKVDTTCAGPNTYVSITLNRTDGMFHNTTCHGTESCEQYNNVGAPGVVDTITITTSGGDKRMMSVVF